MEGKINTSASAKIDKNGDSYRVKSPNVEFTYPKNLNDFIEKYGESLIWTALDEHIRRKLTEAIRRELRFGNRGDDIVSNMSNWSPLVPHEVKTKDEREEELIKEIKRRRLKNAKQ